MRPLAQALGYLLGDLAGLDQKVEDTLAEDLLQAGEVDVVHGVEAAIAKKNTERKQSMRVGMVKTSWR